MTLQSTRRMFPWAITLLGIFPALAMRDMKPAHIASPDHYELLFENERVLALKMALKRGESDAMNRHQNETDYFEKGGKLKIRTGGTPLKLWGQTI